MKHKFQRHIKVLNELLYFCNQAGACEYGVWLSPDGTSMRFVIRAKIPYMRKDLMNSLEDALKLPRTREVEQNYWELEGDSKAELTLIGMMLDKSFAVYEDGVLTITAERLN